MMARDVVSHLMMKFFFKDQVKNKFKTNRVKDEFLKDMNFTLMSGTVSKATRYLQEIEEKEQVSSWIITNFITLDGIGERIRGRPYQPVET